MTPSGFALLYEPRNLRRVRDVGPRRCDQAVPEAQQPAVVVVKRPAALGCRLRVQLDGRPGTGDEHRLHVQPQRAADRLLCANDGAVLSLQRTTDCMLWRI